MLCTDFKLVLHVFCLSCKVMYTFLELMDFSHCAATDHTWFLCAADRRMLSQGRIILAHGKIIIYSCV